MSNNHSIKILRGTRANIAAATSTNNANVLEPGQLLYNSTDNYLTVGGSADGSSDSTVTKLPIIVREVHGYSADNSAIARSVANGTDDWKFGYGANNVVLDVNGLPLEISTDSTEDLTITGAGCTIKLDYNSNSPQITIKSNTGSGVTIEGNNVTATNFKGKADSADKWANNRNFTIVSSDGSGAGSAVPVNGSSNVELKLPSTITADITGSATQIKSGNTSYSIVVTNSTAGTATDTIYFVY